MNVYETSFFSELYNVKSALKDVMRFLAANSPHLTDSDADDLRLIFSELLCNAVIHGNKQDITKKVRVFVETTGDTVTAVISDEGAGFDHAAFLVKAQTTENLTEHGRGIYLVYELADSMSFNVTGNQIKFHKRTRKHG